LLVESLVRLVKTGRPYEAFQLRQKLCGPRVLRKDDVVLSRERYEASVWDTCCKLPTKPNRYPKIIADMQ